MHKRKSTLTVIHQGFLLLLFLCDKGDSQTFIRTCQDPLIDQQHQANTGHTLCYHSCGYDIFVPNGVGLEVCTANGICQCNHACGTAPPANQYGNQCPPYPSDPQDTDPNALPNCIRDCAALCPGGRGLICGEIYDAPIQGTVDTWAKICTCYCPPQPCPTSPTTTTTTATTPAPLTTTGAKAYKVLQKPYPSMFFAEKKLFMVFKMCVLVLKLCVLYLFKLLLLFAYYYYTFHQWINGLFRTMLRTLWGWRGF